jgi:hypothetical protein
MIPEKYRILMNSEIDGENTPAEREELEAYFREHPEARQYFGELRNSLEVLDEWRHEEVEPPLELRDRIMRSVFRPRLDGRGSWTEFLFGRLRLGYALTAAVGILAGLFLHVLIPVDGLSRNLTALDLYHGTTTTEEAHLDGWTPAPAQTFEKDGVRAQVHAFHLEDKVLVRLTLRASRNINLGVRYDPQARMQGILYASNQGYATSSSPGLMELAGTGTCNCEFLVDGVEDLALELQLGTSESDGSLEAKQIRWH